MSLIFASTQFTGRGSAVRLSSSACHGSAVQAYGHLHTPRMEDPQALPTARMIRAYSCQPFVFATRGMADLLHAHCWLSQTS
jgi:hypothetical protein